MTDANTEARRDWIRAGCPGIASVPPILQRDERGRPVFRYVPSERTDIRATFARVRREQRAGK